MYRMFFDVIWFCISIETGECVATAATMHKLFEKVGITCLN
ncbi:hypothetical protein FDJ20_gp101 [Vibrio phage Thalassa]|uniref:Uncharacterized protein n=2 Tax=Thalassavirus TaxID=2948922 RepID=A0A6M9Z282_9CAUD|nr:hypothetical protein FDJ20_gp010 [Vibrio phage Thalassa]YP_009621482.1 hypothetical protein FDJ20_gp101 [Vibrio phage Thalassa]YP_010107859.1 hypothetical protein KNV05_gp011 [Vibrio phage River4]YP_010108040.1 hypothetical protein KNV05_gp101 [Vibrio phage River4]AUG85212.1 hypothetical protein THALASSA_10 [Vibrio phage Thalassa]AUG85401.1 hypothetical protein THALASSA_222 [Vibrio phage Thalassa]QKN84673.1 hypothetical protein RIVER4_11 [Vibrio phage River4]QKN84854.1 hypothetical protei